MLIECLIEREGPTAMTLGSFTYLFRENDHGHKVCPVNSREHRDYLLNKKDFRVYEPPASAPEPNHEEDPPRKTRSRKCPQHRN